MFFIWMMWGCVTYYRVPMRVARVKKFKINVTSHLKIIIFIIKDLQISKCDIIFKNGRFWAFEGVGVPILSHPYRGILSHSDMSHLASTSLPSPRTSESVTTTSAWRRKPRHCAADAMRVSWTNATISSTERRRKATSSHGSRKRPMPGKPNGS